MEIPGPESESKFQSGLFYLLKINPDLQDIGNYLTMFNFLIYKEVTIIMCASERSGGTDEENPHKVTNAVTSSAIARFVLKNKLKINKNSCETRTNYLNRDAISHKPSK